MFITENGGNISIGERKIICITRAILRISKIRVMVWMKPLQVLM